MKSTTDKKQVFILNYADFIIPRIEHEISTLIKAGYDVTVLIWSRKKGSRKFKIKTSPQLTINYFNCWQPSNFLGKVLSLPYVYLKLFANISSQKFDILHFTHLSHLPIALVFKKFKACKTVYDVCEFFNLAIFDSSRKMSFKSLCFNIIGSIEKYFVSHVNGVLTIDSKENKLCEYYRKKNANLAVLWNVCRSDLKIDAQKKASILKQHSGKKLLIYTGVISKQNGLDLMLITLSKLISHYSDIKLLLIGEFLAPKTEEQFTSILNEFNLHKYVEHIPWMPFSEVLTYISCASIGLALYQPNQWHNAVGKTNSRKIFSYLTFGLPILAPKHTLQGQFLEEINAGIAVDTNNIKSIVTALNSLLGFESKRKKLSNNALHAVQTTYNWQSQETKLLSIYENL